MKKIDSKSRQILFYLDENSRMSAADIARKTGISQQIVNYRIKTLIKEEVIYNTTISVNTDIFGWTRYKLYFKFQNALEERILEIVKYLKTFYQISWIVRFEGPYDLVVNYRVLRAKELGEFLEDFSAKYGDFISKRSLSVVVGSKRIRRKYLHKKPIKAKKKLALKETHYNVDNINRYILGYLGENSRISAKDIASKLKSKKSANVSITSEAILKRIRKMEKEQIINSYDMLLNTNKIGMISYILLIKLNFSKKDKLNKFFKDVNSNNSIVYIVNSIGEWDFEINFEVSSLSEYKKALAELGKKNPGMILDYTTLEITNFYRSDMVSGIVLL